MSMFQIYLKTFDELKPDQQKSVINAIVHSLDFPPFDGEGYLQVSAHVKEYYFTNSLSPIPKSDLK